MLGEASQNPWDLQCDLVSGWESVRRASHNCRSNASQETPVECSPSMNEEAIHSFTYSLIQQISIEQKLHTRHCLHSVGCEREKRNLKNKQTNKLDVFI